MSEDNISFFTEDIVFEFDHKIDVRKWINYVAFSEDATIESANVIFCSDAYILSVNREYLSHDYYTDIITFPLMDAGAPIETDIFISLDTVRSNADERKVSFENELLRVIVHGFLHLFGYGDKSKDEASVMRKKEDYYLGCWDSNVYKLK